VSIRKLKDRGHLDGKTSLTECNTGTTQNPSCGVRSKIELQNICTTSENTGIKRSQNIPRWTPLLSDVVIFLNGNVVLIPNGQFLCCATVAFSRRN